MQPSVGSMPDLPRAAGSGRRLAGADRNETVRFEHPEGERRGAAKAKAEWLRAASRRPLPPADLHSIESVLDGDRFEPAPDVARWLVETFIADDAPLQNDEHGHLRFARLGVLWTNARNARRGRRVIGQAETGEPRGAMGKWQRARAAQQLRAWFGFPLPDFIMTLDAHYCAQCSDAAFCALAEHELYHMGHERDASGQPKFHKDTGLPVFYLRGHDVEEFVGVVRRYGAEAAGIKALVDAANAKPEIGAARLAAAVGCGTCLRVAA
jgi:hypothetical protein